MSDDPRDKRLRVSVLVEHDGQSVLIDTSSDFRQQALRQKLRRLDAVLITHCHADHIFGLDDLRPLNFRHGALGIYANERAWKDIRRIFQYVFEPSHFGGGLPQVVAHTVVRARRSPSAGIYRSRRSKSSTGGCPSSLIAATILPMRPT
jgi:phosphoribosyl 1,2-cyclic phosphate phosphodiesterase